jgi:hypothetical protein
MEQMPLIPAITCRKTLLATAHWCGLKHLCRIIHSPDTLMLVLLDHFGPADDVDDDLVFAFA